MTLNTTTALAPAERALALIGGDLTETEQHEVNRLFKRYRVSRLHLMSAAERKARRNALDRRRRQIRRAEIEATMTNAEREQRRQKNAALAARAPRRKAVRARFPRRA